MKSNISILVGLFAIILLGQTLTAYNYFSPMNKFKSLYVDENNLTFDLEDDLIIINSEKVYSDSMQFSAGDDYILDINTKELIFLRPLGYVNVEYKIYPQELLRKYSAYEIIEYSDSTEIDLPAKKKMSRFTDSQLTISGNKTIAISVSNSEDLELDQSLFLRIYGKLSRNLNVEAQLTDSQSPITPEGDSRELSSLDQVFFRVFGRQYEVAFGDLEMELSKTHFSDFSPKFEGLKVGWFEKNTVKGALAISKGKRARIEFSGMDGKQGPYYLFVEETTEILVVPGSEKVYLDGLLKVRGDDYIIDYSEGSITFTGKQFIDSSSRMAVSFQYSDEDFRQNMYLLDATLYPFEKLQITTEMIVQNDDRENPVSEDLDNADIDVLQAAGDNEAWGNGVFASESGDYIFSEEGYYVYVGDDSLQQGEFNIIFSHVGIEEGLYDYDEDGDFYYYTGTGGKYLPIRKLPVPERKDNYLMQIAHWGETYRFSVEGLLTNRDKNTYSGIDDDDNVGRGLFLETVYQPQLDQLKPQIKMFYRNLSKRIDPFSDLHDAFESYEMTPLPDTLAKQEFGGDLQFDLYEQLSSNVSYKHKQGKNYATQKYYLLKGLFRQKLIFPQVDYRYLNWQQDYDTSSQYFLQYQDFKQHDLKLKYEIKRYYIGGNYRQQLRSYRFDTSNREREKQTKQRIYTGLNNSKKFRAEIYIQEESIDSLLAENDWNRTRTVKEAGINSYFSILEQQGSVNYIHRQIETAETNNFDMVEITLQNSFWQKMTQINWNYTIQNLEFYPKIRELQFVGAELGIYDSLGFVVEDGEYDYVITNIDYENPQLSVEVNASTSLFIEPGRVTDSFLQNLSLETFFYLSENSRSDQKRKIYFLDPDIIRNPEYTLYGKQIFDQTVWLDLIPRKLLLRGNYEQSETVDQRYNDKLESENIETLEFMLRWLRVMNSNLELTWLQQEETESRFLLDIEKNELGISLQNSLSPNTTLRSELTYESESGSEQGEQNKYRMKSWNLRESIIWNLGRKYRIYNSISLRNNQRSGSGATSYIDKIDGNIFKWNASFNYRVNSYTYFKIEYTGDNYPTRETVHKLKMEIKAEF